MNDTTAEPQVDEVAHRADDIWHISCEACVGAAVGMSPQVTPGAAICGSDYRFLPINWKKSPCPMCQALLPAHEAHSG